MRCYRDLSTALFAVALWSVTAWGQERGEEKPRTEQVSETSDQDGFIARIKAGDKNGDGRITKEEASDGLKRFFARIDTDGDGVIDEAELKRLQARRGRGRLDRARRDRAGRRDTDDAVQVPLGVKFVPNLAYCEGNEAWRLDLAMPRERSEVPRAGLVFVHGGGWRGGDKRRGYFLRGALEYAQQGYVCVTVNYRLSGEAPFPACVEDVKCAVRWLRAHAEEYNVDPDRIGGYGNSAGAHLVAMLGLVGPDAGLEGDGPHQEQSSLLNAVCASATPTDFLKWREDSPSEFLKRGLLRGPEPSFLERAKRASPLSYARAGAPPFLLVHGTADRTVPVSQADRFVEALRKAGAKDVTYKRYDDEGHGVFNTQSKETHPLMLAFFARTIGRETSKQTEQKAADGKRPAVAAEAIKWPFVPEEVSSPEVITIKSRDGEEATAVLRKPPGDGPFPAIIFLHGGLAKVPLDRLKRSAMSRHTYARYLAAGYVTVAPTFRDRRDDPQSPKALWDCVAIVKHVMKLPYVDSKSVVAFGNSGGGSLALELAGEVDLAASIGGEPATCLFTGLHTKGPPNSHAWLYEDPRRYYTPKAKAFTRAKIEKIRCPVLIVHGDVHPINIINNKVIIPEMKALGKPIDSILYSGCKHGFYFGSRETPWEALNCFRDTLAFAAKHIEVQPQPVKDSRIEERLVAPAQPRPSRRSAAQRR